MDKLNTDNASCIPVCSAVVVAGALSSKSSSKGYQWDFQTPAADQVAAQIQQRAQSGTAGRLVIADLSEGAERVLLRNSW